METKLERNSFEPVTSLSYTAILLPLMAASRIKARMRPSEQDLDREVSPGRAVNAILLVILRAEVRLALAGVHWPIGGSRVVVARAV
jgi:hypothetical protein